MLKTLLIVVVALIAVVLGLAATRPDHFRVERSTTVRAPADKIYPFIDDFHRWTAWSPYEARDPAMKRDHGGAARGVGATYAWAGNREVGEGRMEIVEASAPSKVVIRLEFLKPFEARNQATFTLQPEGAGTRVTWAMEGPSPYLSKLIGLFVSMDRLVGQDFETGLATLKAQAEK
jgi:hypothetical protein